MTAHLVLRFEAPLMSFGAVAVDELRVTDGLPFRSLIVGLLGNALGYRHADANALQTLQQGLSYAVRSDVSGEPLLDYQTTDLGLDFMREGFWTTRGKADERGGASGTGTTIRYRHYLADAVVTACVAHTDPALLDRCAQALRQPARPLFLGRKCCLPSAPILRGVVEAENALDALLSVPLHQRNTSGKALSRWPIEFGEKPKSREIALFEDRDWTNQVHTGRRWLREGVLEYPREGSHVD